MGTVLLRALCTQAAHHSKIQVGGRQERDNSHPLSGASKKELRARLVLSPVSAVGGRVLHDNP